MGDLQSALYCSLKRNEEAIILKWARWWPVDRMGQWKCCRTKFQQEAYPTPSIWFRSWNFLEKEFSVLYRGLHFQRTLEFRSVTAALAVACTRYWRHITTTRTPKKVGSMSKVKIPAMRFLYRYTKRIEVLEIRILRRRLGSNEECRLISLTWELWYLLNDGECYVVPA